MPGEDRVLDPISKDYVDDGKGGWQTTTTLRTALYHQIEGELNGWWGDAGAGSDLFTLVAEAQASETTMNKVAESVRRCLQPFLDLGLAADLVIEVDRNQVNKFVLRGSIRDVQHGVLDLTPLLPFGA